MALKFYLNKFAKVDNIEGYSLSTVKELQKEYTSFLDNCEGIDPDFPMFDFGGKGKKIKGKNAALEDQDNND